MAKSLKREIRPAGVPPSTRPLSHGILVDGWLYVSGQGPLDLKGGRIVPGSIAEETRLTLENVKGVLEAAGCSMDDVVKCTCYLADLGDYDRFNAAYGEYFKGVRPARTTVQAALLGGIKVEIDAVARVPESR